MFLEILFVFDVVAVGDGNASWLCLIFFCTAGSVFLEFSQLFVLEFGCSY